MRKVINSERLLKFDSKLLVTYISAFKKKIETAYDNFANKYDAAMGLSMTLSATQLFHGLKIPENPIVLDVGCGTGIATFELVKRFQDKGVFHGIDLSQKMVYLAKARAMKFGHVNVDFNKGDAEALKFPESSFDLVINNQVFHWIQNKEEALKEMFRVLKPAGQIGLVFQGGPSFKELFEAYDRVRHRHPDYALSDRPRSLTLEETQELFDRAGFQESRISAVHNVTWVDPSIFLTDRDPATSPWRIGLSSENAKKVRKEVAGELLKTKRKDPLMTTSCSIFGYGQKPYS
jgi:ubiquinone/menaquinone biosynthesis C-methylase UbiE